MPKLTQVEINKNVSEPELIAIEDLPDGTCFEFEREVYFMNRISDVIAFSVDGKFAMKRGHYTDQYPTRIFKKVTITLE